MRTSAPDSRAISSFSGRAGGGDDARAERLAELDGREAHAPRRAVDEEPLARLEGGAPDEGGVPGLVDDVEGGGLVERHRVGDRVDPLRGGPTARSA